MRRLRTTALLIVTALTASAPGFPGMITRARGGETPAAPRAAFEDMRFGMFIHWGVYSLLGKGEWVMEQDRLPAREYEKLPARFNPTAFDAEAWVRAAKRAGMKYLTVTSKHHDGFCMFDSKLTRYDVVDSTPYGKDPLKALADACHKNGVTLFFYYSLLDWHHPDYAPLGGTGHHSGREPGGDWSKYVAYYQGQLRELCTNYGEIGGIWFDGWWDRPDAAWDLDGTYALIHKLQPRALVGNNHHVAPIAGEDFQMFERDLPGGNSAGFNKAKPNPGFAWECCETLNGSWGYNASDAKYKTPAEVVRLLASAAGQGANLLLNVGPKPDGTIPKEALERLETVGKWLDKNGASIYGTRRGPIPPQPWGVSTRRPTDPNAPDGQAMVYLHVFHAEGPLVLPDAVVSLVPRLIGGTETLPVTKANGHAMLTIPEADRDPLDTVIVLAPEVLAPERARPLR